MGGNCINLLTVVVSGQWDRRQLIFLFTFSGCCEFPLMAVLDPCNDKQTSRPFILHELPRSGEPSQIPGSQGRRCQPPETFSGTKWRKGVERDPWYTTALWAWPCPKVWCRGSLGPHRRFPTPPLFPTPHISTTFARAGWWGDLAQLWPDPLLPLRGAGPRGSEPAGGGPVQAGWCPC